MRSTLRFAPLLLLALAPALVRADAPAAIDAAARALAEDHGDPDAAAEKAAQAWAAAGFTPEQAAAALSRVYPLEAGPARDHKVTLVDRAGAESATDVLVPPSPRPDGRYGVLIVLHGLRGNSGQLLPYARRIAPPGYIVVAPTAQRLEEAQENEDMLSAEQLLGDLPPPPQDESPEERGRRLTRERMRELMRQAAAAGQRGLLPHWWSYKDDSFALLALDHVRARYRVDPDRVLLTGYSMGGYGAWNIGLRYPDRFAAIAPHAGGISRRENLEARDERSRALLQNAKGLPSFFVHGDRDNVVPTRFSRTIDVDLTKLGADHTYIEVPGGGHVLMSFLEGNDDLKRLTDWSAQRIRDAHPPRIEHAAIGTYQGANRWLRIDGLTRPAGRVSAEVVDGSVIVVDAQSVSKLTVFLDPALVPSGASVRIEVNGVVAHDGPVAPSREAVARSFAGRRDPSLVYTRAVRVTVPPVGDF